jgi:hypothetical protein
MLKYSLRLLADWGRMRTGAMTLAARCTLTENSPDADDALTVRKKKLH